MSPAKDSSRAQVFRTAGIRRRKIMLTYLCFLAALSAPEGRLLPSPGFRQFFMIGICGGYTTFSSFSLQTLNLLRDREWLYAGGNVLLSVGLCMLAVWVGYVLGAVLNSAKGN